MAKSYDKNKIKQRVVMFIVAVLCGVMAFMELAKVSLLADEQRNEWLVKILQQACGSVAVILLLLSMRVKLFGKIDKWLYIIPCIVIAVNNFQWWAFFYGKMRLICTNVADISLFTLQCIMIGLFEELVFRGAVFSLIAGCFSKDKKGLVKTFVMSSIVFGLAHIFSGNFLQVGYTVLTGGLFAFVLLKTKNILCCAFIHALYNFCGLFMDNLGTGAVFDVGTCVFMAIIAVVGASIVLFGLYKYPEEERKELYIRLGVEGMSKTDTTSVENK